LNLALDGTAVHTFAEPSWSARFGSLAILENEEILNLTSLDGNH